MLGVLVRWRTDGQNTWLQMRTPTLPSQNCLRFGGLLSSGSRPIMMVSPFRGAETPRLLLLQNTRPLFCFCLKLAITKKKGPFSLVFLIYFLGCSKPVFGLGCPFRKTPKPKKSTKLPGSPNKKGYQTSWEPEQKKNYQSSWEPELVSQNGVDTKPPSRGDEPSH